jgi:MFS family permease
MTDTLPATAATADKEPAQAAPALSLARDSDFRKLWAGQTVSLFGSLISRTALPFTAALLLDATPADMALLGACDMAPGLIVAPFAGAWADRVRRRPLMVAADVARAVVLCLIPLAAVTGGLRLWHLCAAALLTGSLSMLFDVAYGAYLPTLVGVNRVAEGNAKLTATASAAEVSAFGLSGWLVQWFGGPLAVLADAASFLVSAASLLTIRKPEPAPGSPAAHAGEEGADDALPAGADFKAEIAEGLRTVARDPLLRPLAVGEALLSFSFRVFGTLIILFITKTLKVPTGIQGMVFAVGGVTSLAGALLVGRLSQRLGTGRAMALGAFAAGAGALFIPLAPGPTLAGIALLVAQQVVTDPGYTVFEINQRSLRQAATPNRLRGRVEATFRFLVVAAQLLGIGAAALLGEKVGLRAAMFVGAAGACLSALLLLASPAVRRAR